MSTEQRIPRHVAIIMDGNGRWAKKKLLPRAVGHRQGAKAVERVVEAARKGGVEYLTLFCFSSENWNRPADEIKALMSLLEEYIEKEIVPLAEKGVRVRFSGQLHLLPQKIQEMIVSVNELSVPNQHMTLILALSYGGRGEIVDAVKKIATAVLSGETDPQEITEDYFSQSLYLPDVPDPDLLIRTSGEKRISNFLLWQLAYSEIIFTDTLWPDFSIEDFSQAIDEYASRSRRFGKV